jgi:hypothetical protein
VTTPPPFRPIDSVALAGEMFSEQDATAIIAAVNGTAAGQMVDADEYSGDLARSLNVLAGAYMADDYQQDLPRSHEIKARLDDISSLSKRLIKALGARDGGVSHDLGPGVLWKSAKLRGEPSGEAAVSHAVGELRKLQQWAEFAGNLAGIETQIAPPVRGARPDKAMGTLVKGLGETFLWLWQQPPSRSADRTGLPGRFAVFTGEVLGRIVPQQFTPARIEGLIRRHLDLDEIT